MKDVCKSLSEYIEDNTDDSILNCVPAVKRRIPVRLNVSIPSWEVDCRYMSNNVVVNCCRL